MRLFQGNNASQSKAVIAIVNWTKEIIPQPPDEFRFI